MGIGALCEQSRHCTRLPESLAPTRPGGMMAVRVACLVLRLSPLACPYSYCSLPAAATMLLNHPQCHPWPLLAMGACVLWDVGVTPHSGGVPLIDLLEAAPTCIDSSVAPRQLGGLWVLARTVRSHSCSLRQHTHTHTHGVCLPGCVWASVQCGLEAVAQSARTCGLFLCWHVHLRCLFHVMLLLQHQRRLRRVLACGQQHSSYLWAV